MKKKFGLMHVRLILSGAVAGVAIAGLVAPAFGAPKESNDLIGLLLGSGTAAVVLKFIHLV